MKNISMRQFADFVRDYKNKVSDGSIVNENKNRHVIYQTNKEKQLKNCFDYFMAKKNSQMIQAYKEIFGLNNDDIRCAVDMAKNGYVSPTKNQRYKNDIKELTDALDYDRRKSFDYINDMVNSVKKYRAKSKLGSHLDEKFHKQTNILDKWAKISLEVAREWWNSNHQRTEVKLGVYGLHHLTVNRYGNTNDKRVISDDNVFYDEKTYCVQPDESKSYYPRNALEIPSLWYLKIYRHGLHTVVYKSRPCMVIKLTPKPIQRLKDKGYDVYKADLIQAKSQKISYIKDVYLVAYKTKDWSRHSEGKQHLNNSERTFAPHRFDNIGESLTACNESLSIAENTISGRLVSGISNALDI